MIINNYYFVFSIIFIVILIFIIIQLIRANKKLNEHAFQAFDNEQGLANMLDETYNALYLSNIELMRHNVEGNCNDIIKKNRVILDQNNLQKTGIYDVLKKTSNIIL